MPLMKIGGAFLVNTYTTNDQRNPSVTGLTDGNFVVTWQSQQDGTGQFDIYGQVFTPTGSKIGAEFLINTNTSFDQSLPSVTRLTNGGFVVTWTSYAQGNAIYSQIFTSTGAKIGSEFLVSNYSVFSSATGLTNGNFVITWENNAAWYGDIYAQIFTSAGAKIGSAFLVNTYTTERQEKPSITVLTNGNFVVTWQSNVQDGSSYGVYAQVLSATGAKVGSEFLVNTYTTNDQSAPSVTGITNGNFVVAWEGEGQNAYRGIYVQVYSETGIKIDSNFLVNSTPTSVTAPSVVGLTNGNFVVTWQAYNGVYAQLLSAAGAKIGPEFLVNTYTADRQSNPSVTSLINGNFVVTWQSYGKDGSNWGIYGQIFYPSFGFSVLNQPIRYTEDTPFNLRGIVVAPVSNPTITATLTLSNPMVGSLTTGVSGDVYSNYDTLTGTWQASGAVQSVNNLLGEIQYLPSRHFVDNFNVTVTILDGAYSLNDLMIITGPPILTSNNAHTLVYTEHDAPLVLDSSLELRDVNANFAQANISFASGFIQVEDNLIVNPVRGITNNYNKTTGILSLYGLSSITNYQSALQSIRYQNLANYSLNYTPRNITITAQDSDGIWTKPVVKSISILPDYTPPKIEHNSLTLAQGSEVILTASNIAASDQFTPEPLLEFTVSNVKNGYFENVHASGHTINHFSQSEILNHNIRFIHNGKPEKPAYDVTAYNLDGVKTEPAAATVAFTPTSSSYTNSNIIRNSIIGGAVSGVIGLGFFALKHYLSRKIKETFESALNPEEANLKTFHQQVIRPIARKIMNSIKIRGNLDCDIENTSNTLVEAVGSIVFELQKMEVNVDLPNLDSTDKKRLIDEITNQIRNKLIPKNQYSFCSKFTGFYAAEVYPEQIEERAKDIAIAVASALKTTPVIYQAPSLSKGAVLSNGPDIEMKELGDDEDNEENNENKTKKTRRYFQFPNKTSMFESLLK